MDLYCLYKAFDTMASFQDISEQVEGELLRSENELVYYDVMASGGDTTAACKRLVSLGCVFTPMVGAMLQACAACTAT